MTTLNPEPCISKPLEDLVALFRKDTDAYAAGFTNESVECPNGIPRKITIYSKEARKKIVIEKPPICDCNNARFVRGIGTRTCKMLQVCPVRQLLFPKGTFS